MYHGDVLIFGWNDTGTEHYYWSVVSSGYYLVVRHMGLMKNLYGMDTPIMYGFLSMLLIFSNIVWDISNGIFKHAIEPLLAENRYSYVVANVQYFCAFTSIIFSLFVLGVLFLFGLVGFARKKVCFSIFEVRKRSSMSIQNRTWML